MSNDIFPGGKLEGFRITDENGNVLYDESMPTVISTRHEMMQVNLQLTDELAAARKERDAALAETARVTALFESCIPPTAAQWLFPQAVDYQFGIGWDTCRQKLIDLLRRPR